MADVLVVERLLPRLQDLRIDLQRRKTLDGYMVMAEVCERLNLTEAEKRVVLDEGGAEEVAA